MNYKKKQNNEHNDNFRINCNVSTCTHNSLEDSTCRLNEINVSRISAEESGDADKDTACHSYKFIGTENTYTNNYTMR